MLQHRTLDYQVERDGERRLEAKSGLTGWVRFARARRSGGWSGLSSTSGDVELDLSASSRPRLYSRRVLGSRILTESGSEPAWLGWVNAGLLGVLGVMGVRNAVHYPSIGGYDAAEHIEYARGLVDHLELPAGTGTYYTPPLFHALAGPLLELGDALGLADPGHVAQLLNAVVTLATGIVLLWLARLVFPGRPLVATAALALFVCTPVVLRIGAMFHPQPLVMLLATVALALTARMIVRNRFGIADAVLLGLVLGAGQLVRSVGLWAVGVVVLALATTALVRPDARRRAATAVAITAALAVAIPVPWYVYLGSRYEDPVFGRPVIGSPAAASVSLRFVVTPGLPETLTSPQRRDLAPAYFPIMYADTWGDYFGIWSWGETPPRPALDAAHGRRLVVQGIAGLLPTLLALVGWLSLLALALGRLRVAPERLAVALMPLAALVGTLYYAIRSPLTDGDTVKAMFALPAIPAIAVCFGFVVDAVASRRRRLGVLLLVTLAACLLVSLEYTWA